MVTDEQYRILQKKVDELEKKIILLSRQYSTLYMKHDMQVLTPTENYVTNRRDTTRYIFRDQQLCKRELVLACVKQFIAEHPGITGDSLTETFPDYIQGSLGIIRKVTEAEKYSTPNRRFFFADEDVLFLPDGEYVVCAQWDKKNIDRFIALAKDLGYQIEIKKRKY